MTTFSNNGPKLSTLQPPDIHLVPPHPTEGALGAFPAHLQTTPLTSTNAQDNDSLSISAQLARLKAQHDKLPKPPSFELSAGETSGEEEGSEAEEARVRDYQEQVVRLMRSFFDKSKTNGKPPWYKVWHESGEEINAILKEARETLMRFPRLSMGPPLPLERQDWRKVQGIQAAEIGRDFRGPPTVLVNSIPPVRYENGAKGPCDWLDVVHPFLAPHTGGIKGRSVGEEDVVRRGRLAALPV